jgi:ankyrin repeat protein
MRSAVIAVAALTPGADVVPFSNVIHIKPCGSHSWRPVLKRPVLLLAALAFCPALLGAQNLFTSGATAQDVKSAVAAGVNLEETNKDGLTALIYAASNNSRVEVVRALIEA